MVVRQRFPHPWVVVGAVWPILRAVCSFGPEQALLPTFCDQCCKHWLSSQKRERIQPAAVEVAIVVAVAVVVVIVVVGQDSLLSCRDVPQHLASIVVFQSSLTPRIRCH